MMQKKREKNNGKGDSASAPSRFACPRVKCNKFWQKDTGKTKRMTNWSVSTFKSKLKFFRLKIVKYKTRAFNRKIDPILLNISLIANNHFWCCCPFFASDLMHNSTGYVIKHSGKFGEHSRSVRDARGDSRGQLYLLDTLQTSQVLHSSIVHR